MNSIDKIKRNDYSLLKENKALELLEAFPEEKSWLIPKGRKPISISSKNGYIFKYLLGGEGTHWLPFFSFPVSFIHREEYLKLSEQAKKEIDESIKIFKNVNVPEEAIEYIKIEDSLIEKYPNLFIKESDSSDRYEIRDKEYKCTTYLYNAGLDFVTGIAFYQLRDRICKESWAKIRKYFIYYKENSDLLDFGLFANKAKGWYTSDYKEVTKILKSI